MQKRNLSGVEVTEALTRQVAHLARLELTEEETRTFTAQLGQILHYVDQLQELDVSNVSPMTHPFDLETPMRDDEARPSPVDLDNKPKMLSPAPEVVDSGFKVPPIL